MRTLIISISFFAVAGFAHAQNPGPCSQATNGAISGQVLSAASTGQNPPCTWITGGGGGGTGNAATTVTTAFSTTPTFTANSNTATTLLITLTGNVASSTLAGATTGQILTFRICQDGTGSRAFVFPANVLGNGTVSATASLCSNQDFRFDGTNANAIGAMYVTGGTGGAIGLPGSSSGATTLQSSATASGVLTLPAATDTLIAKATTDTLTNKTFDTAGAGNSLKINGTGITAVSGTGAVCLASGSACAAGAAAFTPVIWPYGGMTTGETIPSWGTANQVTCYYFPVYSPGLSPANLAVFGSSTGVGSTAYITWAFYTVAGSLVTNGQTNTVAISAEAAFNFTWATSPALSAGTNYLLCTSGATGASTLKIFGGTQDGGYAGSMANTGGALNVANAANASTGTSTLVMPATLGTLTAINNGGAPVLPGLVIH